MHARIAALALFGTLLLAAPSGRAEDGRLSGLWREVGSTLIRCQGCLSIVRHGTVLTVDSEAGWSAVVTTDSYGYPSYAVGTGWWHPEAIAKHADAPFEVYLALAGDRLLVVSTTSGTHDPFASVTYEKRQPAQKRREVLRIKVSDE